MAKNKMTDLRDHLFDVIERLKNPEEETKMDVPTAKAITEAAQVIINTAKLEIDYMQAVDNMNGAILPSDFVIKTDPEQKKLTTDKF